MSSAGPTQRFSDRVADYVRYRPTYPREVLRILAQEAGLGPDSVIADVGAGTGISTRLFLENGNAVAAVEPNAEMRAAAEADQAGYPRFRSLATTAEETGLPDHSVDFVVAAQAFHWFDQEAVRREFARILKPGGWVVLLWNSRRLDRTPFLRAYEALLLEYGTDYQQVRHEQIDRSAVERFYGPGGCEYRMLENVQVFDRAGLRGRLLSSSYVPAAGDPRREALLRKLDAVFDAHQSGGTVDFEYDTELYFGRLT